MPHCFHVGCSSSTGKGCAIGLHFFKCPKVAEIQEIWIKNIPKQTNKTFNFKRSVLCNLHFDNKFLVKESVVELDGVVIASEPRKKWTLTHDAVPTIFSNEKVPQYLNKPLQKRKAPTKRRHLSPKKTKVLLKPSTDFSDNSDNLSANHYNCSDSNSSGSNNCNKTRNDTPNDCEQPSQDENDSSAPSTTDGSGLENDNGKSELKLFLRQNLELILLPSKKWMLKHSESVDESLLTMFELSAEATVPSPNRHNLMPMEIVRIVQVSHELEARIHVKGMELPRKQVTSLDDINNLLNEVGSKKICGGVDNYGDVEACKLGLKRSNNVWFSSKCAVLHEKDCCEFCEQLKRNLSVIRCRSKKRRGLRHLETPSSPSKSRAYVRKKLASARQQLKRIRLTRAQDRLIIKNMKKKFTDTNQELLLQCIDKCEGMPEHTKTSFKEAVKAAQQQLKGENGKYGIRYEPEWLLQCLLLKITSPKAYRFLRDNKTLPLPHRSSLDRLIRGLPCSFGFSDSVLSLLKGRLDSADLKYRHGSLVFDEMKVNTSLDFDKNTMQFKGFVDFDDLTDLNYDNLSDKTAQLADHALVFMFRPFNDSWVQPIAAFASKNAASGDILSKLILASITKLEESAALVDCIVSDGATSNKNVWKRFGIVGDMGANVENKFNNEDAIFAHYRIVHNEEKVHHLRAAFKITDVHLNPDNFQKMVVSYAVQLFSQSVADALQFYKDLKAPGLHNCGGTINLTAALNELFDALNSRRPKEGLRLNSRQYEVISNFSAMLDDKKLENTFGAAVTMGGLRVTLKSVLELARYLIEDAGFLYVLTSKFNQDCLEKFFGLIRSFNGDNDHPTITSFSYLYRLLSLYQPLSNILKSNITSGEKCSVTLTSFMASLKQSRQEVEQANRKIRDGIKAKISESIIIIDPVEDSEIDHDYWRTTSWNCKIFQIAGFLAFRAAKFSNCVQCQLSLLSNRESASSSSPYAHLTNIKNNGRLKYPSENLFHIIRDIEPKIEAVLETENLVGDLINRLVNDLGAIKTWKVGCEDSSHTSNLVATIVSYYISTRMYFFIKITNKQVLKSTNKTKKRRKIAKLS